MNKIGLERSVPKFSAGDTIKVDVKIIEGDKERIQAFEGLCIARSGGGLNESFTVRKISFGEGVDLEVELEVRRSRVNKEYDLPFDLPGYK